MASLGPAYDAQIAGDIAIEEAAAAAAAGHLRAQLGHATRQITTLYIRLAGSLDSPLPAVARRQFAQACSDLIAAITVNLRAALTDLVAALLARGQQQALAHLPEGTALAGAVALHPWVGQVAGTIDDRIRAVLAQAQANPQINPAATWRDTQAHIAYAGRAATLADRDTRWATNAAINTGVRYAADQAGTPRMWIAERDACLHCLAYSGQIAQPHQPYPAGLTYYIDPRGQPKPLNLPVVWGPPLHPNCRCRERPYLGLRPDYPLLPGEQPVGMPEALQREARRSVLRGQSGSDSLPARLRATGVLLQRGARLPKSVEERGRAAVAAGGYR